MRPATTCARSPHAGPMSVAFGLSYAAVGKSLHTHAAHAQGHGPTDSSAQRSRLCSVPPATTAIVQRAPCRYTGNWVFSSQLSFSGGCCVDRLKPPRKVRKDFQSARGEIALLCELCESLFFLARRSATEDAGLDFAVFDELALVAAFDAGGVGFVGIQMH